jgi:hypothetical protein
MKIEELEKCHPYETVLECGDEFLYITHDHVGMVCIEAECGRLLLVSHETLSLKSKICKVCGEQIKKLEVK